MGYLLSIDDLDGQTNCTLCSKYIDIDYSNNLPPICDKCDIELEQHEKLYNKLIK